MLYGIHLPRAISLSYVFVADTGQFYDCFFAKHEGSVEFKFNRYLRL